MENQTIQPAKADIYEPHPVQNRWEGRGPYRPKAIVEHMMQGSIEATEQYFNHRINGYMVSAHYGIARDGSIWQFVPEEDTAWSNGVIQQPDLSLEWIREAVNNGVNLNLVTIAIEHEGVSGEPLTEAQYRSTLNLHKEIIKRWDIPADEEHIVGHNRLDSIGRAEDPGPDFPLDQLLKDLGKPEGKAQDEEENARTRAENALTKKLEFPPEPLDPPEEIKKSEETYPDYQGDDLLIRTNLGQGKVTVDLANVRKTPGFDQSSIMHTAPRGAILAFDGYGYGPVLQGKKVWLHITGEYGYGWIHSTLVQLKKAYSVPNKK